MVTKTLCRAYAYGDEYKVVRVHWVGRGDGFTYRVYQNRRRFNRDEYANCEQAFLIMAEKIKEVVTLEDWVSTL